MKKDNKDLQFRKYISTMTSDIRTMLFHGEYEMNIEYIADDKKRNSWNESRFNTYADIDIDFRYLRFTIAIYPIIKKLYEEKQGWQILNIITHEMCHLLTEPLYYFAIPIISNTTQETLEEVRERQTQRIANVIVRFVPEKVWKLK